jgi:DNA invertase Pin-like site-specific DNA recombinase
MRVAVYSRQSTPNDDQVEEHVRWCVERVERNGDTVVGPFRDDGISGFKRKVRPGYEAMLAGVAAGEVDAIIAAMYDRLLRDHREGTRFADLLEAAGVMDVLLVKESDIDLRTADGRQVWRDRASAAEGYSDRLSGKVKDSKERIARNGRLARHGVVNDHGAVARQVSSRRQLELTRHRGIGRWTADIYLTMCLLRPDVWPRGDLALRTAAAELIGSAKPSDIELAERAESWRPFRAVAARILWHDYLRRRGLPV